MCPQPPHLHSNINATEPIESHFIRDQCQHKISSANAEMARATECKAIDTDSFRSKFGEKADAAPSK